MITCRNASLPELTQFLDWAAAEGWNPGLSDAAAFFAADPQGFFVATNGAGELMAAISVVNHSEAFAFLGLYIVLPEHRGRGIGLTLWQHALHHAGQRTIGLDGVEAQQDNYAASGFVHAGGTTRFTGMVTGQADKNIREAAPPELPALIAQEAAASGVAKPAYLRAWLTPAADRRTLVSTDARGINGFCTVRTCRSGSKLGPLVARDKDIAHRLIRHAATLAGGEITLDVPDSATHLSALCADLGLTPGVRTARMYRGPFSPGGHPTYAVTSLELG